jgi:hypothetical protein
MTTNEAYTELYNIIDSFIEFCMEMPHDWEVERADKVLDLLTDMAYTIMIESGNETS